MLLVIIKNVHRDVNLTVLVKMAPVPVCKVLLERPVIVFSAPLTATDVVLALIHLNVFHTRKIAMHLMYVNVTLNFSALLANFVIVLLRLLLTTTVVLEMVRVNLQPANACANKDTGDQPVNTNNVQVLQPLSILMIPMVCVVDMVLVTAPLENAVAIKDGD